MLWLALQFPRLGLEVWTQGDASNEVDRPLVLLEDNRVLLGNEAAVQAGIQPGATLATAHSIDGRLLHHERDVGREEKRLRFLADALYRFSAQVSLEAPDAVVLEIGGSQSLFGLKPEQIQQEAQSLCLALGHEVRTALATTSGAALALATAGLRRLEAVPLAHARLPAAKHLEKLANMGLKTLGALIRLPDVELSKRFGPEMVDYLARLTGRMPDPRSFIEPAAQFDQALYLLEPVKDKETLHSQAGNAPMERLLAELEVWLVSHQLGAEQLVWSFSTHSEEDRVVFPVSFARAQQQQNAFIKIIRLKLEQVELPDDILNVRLEALRFVPWLGGSRQLFKLLTGDGEMSESDSSELIDQLHARLGHGACTRITCIDQHAPEAAWQPLRPSARGSARGSKTTRGPRTARSQSAYIHGKASPVSPHGDRSPRRPLWLFDPPHPANPDQLTLLKGPERIQTAWWQETVRRDYYVAALENGARCWAFVDARNQWFLHGYFG